MNRREIILFGGHWIADLIIFFPLPFSKQFKATICHLCVGFFESPSFTMAPKKMGYSDETHDSPTNSQEVVDETPFIELAIADLEEKMDKMDLNELISAGQQLKEKAKKEVEKWRFVENVIKEKTRAQKRQLAKEMTKEKNKSAREAKKMEREKMVNVHLVNGDRSTTFTVPLTTTVGMLRFFLGQFLQIGRSKATKIVMHLVEKKISDNPRKTLFTVGVQDNSIINYILPENIATSSTPNFGRQPHLDSAITVGLEELNAMMIDAMGEDDETIAPESETDQSEDDLSN